LAVNPKKHRKHKKNAPRTKTYETEDDDDDKSYTYNPKDGTFVTQLGNKYECKSHCGTIFAPSCDRCTYPLAFYNKTVTDKGKCFTNFVQLQALTPQQVNAAKDLCRTKGKCTCQSFEKFDFYMQHACQVQCKNFVEGKTSVVFLPKGDHATCKKFRTFAMKNQWKRQHVEEVCKNNEFTIPYLINKFDIKDIFKSKLFLTDQVLEPGRLSPSEEFEKALNTKFNRGESLYVVSKQLYFCFSLLTMLFV